MAWDNDRPYAPFCVFGENTISYKRGERECMEPYAYDTPTEEDIDLIYDSGSLVCGLFEFRPFKDVELTLAYETFTRGRSAVTFYWRDKNNVRYPMFAKELDRLLRDGLLKNTIHGYWSAEKRGANYGIRLDNLVEDQQ